MEENQSKDKKMVWIFYEYGVDIFACLIFFFAKFSIDRGVEQLMESEFSSTILLILTIKFFTQISISIFLRFYYLNFISFHPFVSIFINSFVWPICLFLLLWIFMSAGHQMDRYSEFFSIEFLKTMVSVFGPYYAASLLAPLLVYRFTGYLFDADFSQPPWSHGKWGFRKPAAVPVEPQPK